MRALSAAIALFMLAGTAVADDPATTAGTPPRIGRITIVSRGLFDAGAAQGAFYRMANALHSPTREPLIRSFLLFDEGDLYDPVADEHGAERSEKLHIWYVTAF